MCPAKDEESSAGENLPNFDEILKESDQVKDEAIVKEEEVLNGSVSEDEITPSKSPSTDTDTPSNGIIEGSKTTPLDDFSTQDSEENPEKTVNE